MHSVRSRLVEDYQEIIRLLQWLRDAADGAESPRIHEVWGLCKQRLTEHMEAEERYLLPILEAQYPREAECVRRDHAEIRSRVAELGVHYELRLLRKTMTQDLMDLVSMHAAWEEKTLYRGLEVFEPPPGLGIRAVLAKALKPLHRPHGQASFI